MRDRALQICSNTNREPEMRHLKEVFQANGFPENLIRKTLARRPPPPAPREEPSKTLCTPYIRGLSEKLEKVCNALGISTAFKPVKTLRQTLMKVKTRVPEEKRRGVVYEVPCKDCSKTYVGETKRTLKVRLGEHRQAVKRGDPKNGIAVHVHNTQHAIDWTGAKVSKTEANYWRRRTMEAIQIKTNENTMNLDSGLLLPSVWNPVLNPP